MAYRVYTIMTKKNEAKGFDGIVSCVVERIPSGVLDEIRGVRCVLEEPTQTISPDCANLDTWLQVTREEIRISPFWFETMPEQALAFVIATGFARAWMLAVDPEPDYEDELVDNSEEKAMLDASIIAFINWRFKNEADAFKSWEYPKGGKRWAL